eukprot:TRINITY_DN61020_c0_g1_i1.p1 TRINITY_DN61020_c0_g1~~TRINITY_DN61020_c0_g1_i1.p1  ORF type:complete len:241 (+),score=55.06 TRINITY_DN61020_c0_g1_i1:238-960(+)
MMPEKRICKCSWSRSRQCRRQAPVDRALQPNPLLVVLWRNRGTRVRWLLVVAKGREKRWQERAATRLQAAFRRFPVVREAADIPALRGDKKKAASSCNRIGTVSSGRDDDDDAILDAAIKRTAAKIEKGKPSKPLAATKQEEPFKDHSKQSERITDVGAAELDSVKEENEAEDDDAQNAKEVMGMKTKKTNRKNISENSFLNLTDEQLATKGVELFSQLSREALLQLPKELSSEIWVALK